MQQHEQKLTSFIELIDLFAALSESVLLVVQNDLQKNKKYCFNKKINKSRWNKADKTWFEIR